MADDDGNKRSLRARVAEQARERFGDQAGWAAIFGLATAGLAALSLLVLEDSWLRAPVAICAVLTAVAYVLAWRMDKPPRWMVALWGGLGGIVAAALRGAVALWRGLTRIPVLGVLVRIAVVLVRGLIRIALLIGLSLLPIAGFVVAFAVILGKALGPDTEPLGTSYMYVGLAGLLALVAFIAYSWARSGHRILYDQELPRWHAVIRCALVTVIVLGVLSHREVPDEIERSDTEQALRAGLGRHDLLLVVDPADPAARRLIRAARRSLTPERATRMFTTGDGGVEYDVAIGIAVPRPRGGDEPLWSLVQPPTKDHLAVAKSLSRIDARERRSAAGSYGRVLSDSLRQTRAQWRPFSERGLAFVLDELPSLGELDAHFRGARRRAAIAPDAYVPNACVNFLDARHDEQPVPDDPAAPVAWGDALAEHCRRLLPYRNCTVSGRPADFVPDPSVGLHALTGDGRAARSESWQTWAEALDGRFHRPRRGELLRDALRIQTGEPFGSLAELVHRYRPYLFFDEDDDSRPIDIDWLLRSRGGEAEDSTLCDLVNRSEEERDECDATRRGHVVCDRRDGTDDCEPIRGVRSLAGTRDEYMNFEGVGRFGRNLAGGAQEPARMYVHVREHGSLLFLGYWWFFQYNTSPWQTEVNCLPGLTFSGISCHDHQGDWEGVTVVLRMTEPESRDRHRPDTVVLHQVLYDSHGHPIPWDEDDLQLLEGDDGRTHPLVLVAAGSHASYPAPCQSRQCSQSLAGGGLPEGGFAGDVAWTYNNDERCAEGSRERPTRRHPDGRRIGPCLIGLPSTRDGLAGASWNAFPGAWGRANCTIVGKICSSVEGPWSPSLQGRYKHPEEAKPRKLKGALGSHHDRYGPLPKALTGG